MLLSAKHKFLPRTAFAAVILSLFAAAPAWPQQAPAQSANGPAANTETLPRITVEGIGAAGAKPDMAVLQISVSHEAKTAKDAVAQVNQSLNPLLAALKKSLPEKDIRSSGWTVGPVYSQDNERKNKQQKSFRAVSQLSVKIRETKQVGAIIDAALAAGATEISDLSWTNSETEPLYREARRQAVANALEKTASYARAANAETGRILRIEEGGADSSPRFYARAAAPIMADTAVAEGENSYTARVQITTELINKTR